jgi:iron complex transport system ATP-binding protein
MTAVELTGVYARYGEGRGDQLRDVSMTLREGELCALLGPNGAGKSTLVRLIAGLIEPRAGELCIQGAAASSLTRTERARQIAVVPQRSEVSLGFTVAEVVAMGRAPHQGALLRTTIADREAVARALETCELERLEHRPVAELSGGEQKRVHIARALAQQAPILLLDEAAAHLDLRHNIALHRLIGEEVRARGLACLAAMHDLATAAHYADRVILLKEGAVVAAGSVEEVMTAELLSQTFEVDIEVGEVPRGGRYFVPRGAD